jgi:hypothetical protein
MMVVKQVTQVKSKARLVSEQIIHRIWFPSQIYSFHTLSRIPISKAYLDVKMGFLILTKSRMSKVDDYPLKAEKLRAH